ncbi:MAG: hypothetical protein ETSY2_54030 [Candidatus Entotheonella gemina]|uniref:Uncharacterized protein n=1 Tax=Candidatus Entotheonella gemina TaxID=1429439 RepID=W4L2H5_9BACT|nr:MAG: hypothetical protein ETSY2_54030 [Candidatus Entotheonella gemina]
MLIDGYGEMTPDWDHVMISAGPVWRRCANVRCCSGKKAKNSCKLLLLLVQFDFWGFRGWRMLILLELWRFGVLF